MKDNSEKILRLNNIVKSYQEKIVINKFSVEINYGESVGIFGKNGSGKSTLLKVCCGLLKPDSGIIEIMGKTFDSPEESLVIKSRMGVMMHEDMLYPQLSVKENWVFYSKILGIKNIDNIIEEISSLLNIEKYLKTPVMELSNGNKRKVSFGKSLLNEPDILFVDEPESNIDDEGIEIISNVFNDRKRKGLANLFSTHSEKFLNECSSQKINLKF